MELKPCPFCGCLPIIHLGKKTGCQLHGEPMQGIIIRCNFNGCFAKPSIETGNIYNGGHDNAKTEAIKAWNNRSENKDRVECQ